MDSYRVALDACAEMVLVFDREDRWLLDANRMARYWLHNTCAADLGNRVDDFLTLEPNPFSVSDAMIQSPIAVWPKLIKTAVHGEVDRASLRRMAVVQTVGQHLIMVISTDQERIVGCANLDPLTGLPGRNAIMERLKRWYCETSAPCGWLGHHRELDPPTPDPVGSDIVHESSSPTRPCVPQPSVPTPPEAHGLALLFIDLDNFKEVNDRWGHLAGDAVLASVARKMASCIRSKDLFARYGGDEFVALLSGVVTQQDAGLVADRIRACLTDPLNIDGSTILLTASIGIAMGSEGFSSPEALIHAADQRMYSQKHDPSGPMLRGSSTV
ncbi:MAG: GGDEF domain-containing protein [Pirellulales bacterium]|nr:GGDEF domain-containing protein [Pirellulales bacterium]